MEPTIRKPVFFNKVIVRAASLPFEPTFKEDAFFEHLLGNPLFMKALFHAHPLVFRKVKDWTSGKLQDNPKIQKLKQTLYNYYTRMYSNIVPFGFFSSVGLAEWHKEETRIELSGFTQRVKLDMEALAALVNYIGNIPSVRESVKYYSNNTLYQTGTQFRYVEVSFRDNKAGYKISAVEHSDFLAEVFAAAAGGITIQNMAAKFAGEDYTEEELSDFFHELVNEQLLVSELQLNVTGPDPFTRLAGQVKSLQKPGDTSVRELVLCLDRIESILQQLNNPGNDFYDLYDQLVSLFTSIPLSFDERHVLQVDNFAAFGQAHLSEEIQSSLYESVKALSCFNQNDYKPFLESFKTRFTEKYEDAWVPLMRAIDTESGVSFGYFTFIGENALTSEIDFVKKDKDYLSRNAGGDQLRYLLYKKYLEACLNKKYTVQLTRDDFKNLTDKVGRLAPTFQVVFNIINEKENLLVLRTAGNSSGGNLISRFAYASGEITTLLKGIAQAEQTIYKESILAEVVHIPDHRIGNITFRPVFRDYEIPVLTLSVMPAESQIPLDDLLISVRDGRIVLWSKKLNKRVIPVLTNAHNYGLNTSPVYQLLSELVYQDMIPSLFMDRGELSYMSVFNRRIQFENVILYPATWNFEKDNLQELLDNMHQLDDERIAAFKEKWNLPRRTNFSDNGSHILVQWDSVLSVTHFLKAIQKKTGTLFMEEYLFDEQNCIIKDSSGQAWQSEFIAIINNTGKFIPDGPSYDSREAGEGVKQKFFPGDEWVYCKIYTGVKTSNRLLQNELQEAITKLYTAGTIGRFFFIRYNDPDYHLRLRIMTGKENVSTVIEAIRASLSYYIDNHFIWKMQLDTYTRELDRYGWTTIDFSESVFEADSRFHIGILPLLEENYAMYAPLFFMKGVDSLLHVFGFDIEKKYRFIEKKKKSYEQEFTVPGNISLKASLDKKEKDLRKPVEDFMKDNWSDKNPQPELFYELLGKREAGLENLLQENIHLFEDEAAIENLVNSFVHMFAIRLFQTSPRENELVGYYVLYFYYHKCIKTQQKVVL